MKKNVFWGFIGIVLIAIFAMGYYAISPLFRNIVVDETSPAVVDSIEPTTMRQIIDTPAHPASGVAGVIQTPSGYVLRYENFKTINGPDLYVYLSTDTKASEYISLGRIRGTEGNINYEIPSDVDPNKYRYALVWCEKFGVLFNYVDLKENSL